MRRYLIVDDNAAFAENLAEILREQGDEVVVASSGHEALALRSARYDALVTDMRMPVMTGAVLVHELRQHDPGLPAIVVTAYTGEDDLTSAREEGLLAVLPKPAPIPRLLELLAAARRDALVAIVEDDPALADNLCEALRDRGFSAVTARSVTETERLGSVRPFAGIVDLRVPGGPDGEAARRLAAAFPELPLLVVSAFARGDGQTGAVAGFFPKPFDTGALLSAIEQLHSARGRAS
jgi:CheY-like chemotaxis protein